MVTANAGTLKTAAETVRLVVIRQSRRTCKRQVFNKLCKLLVGWYLIGILFPNS